MMYEGGVAVNLRTSITQVAKLNNQLDCSPTLKARRKPLTKTELEETVFSQFPSKESKQASLYGRAIKIYERQRELRGIQRRDIGKPKEVFHAHIEAMDDRIEIQRYGRERQAAIEGAIAASKQK